MKLFKFLLLNSLLLNVYLVNAQYVGQINNASILYNPSFVGSKNAFRIASGAAANGPAYTTTYLSLDTPIKIINGAIGFSFQHVDYKAISAKGYNLYDYKYTYSENDFNFTYAQIFTHRDKNRDEIFTVRPAITLAMNKYARNMSYSNGVNNSFPFNDFTIIPSVMISNKKSIIGLKYQYYNPQNFEIKGFDYGNIVKYRLNLLLSHSFQRDEYSSFSFTPMIEYQFDNRKKEYFNNALLNVLLGVIKRVNLNFKYKKYICGLYDSGMMNGYQSRNTRVSSIIGWTRNYGLSAEISMNYILK